MDNELKYPIQNDELEIKLNIPFDLRKCDIVEHKWGQEFILMNNEQCIKLLVFKPGFMTSRHLHRLHSEGLFCLRGYFTIFKNIEKIVINTGDNCLIPSMTTHHISTLGGGVLLEVAQSVEEDTERFGGAEENGEQFIKVNGV